MLISKKSAAVLLIFVFALGLTCYKIGFEKGYSSYRTSQKVRFVMSLSELQSLRDSNLRPVIDKLENACYSSALFVLKDSRNDSDPIIRKCLQQLSDYCNAPRFGVATGMV